MIFLQWIRLKLAFINPETNLGPSPAELFCDFDGNSKIPEIYSWN